LELLHLKHTPKLSSSEISLPSSKSESNRALILNAFCNNTGNIENISEARDSQTMMRLLDSEEEVLDVIDAGTTMRFLTAYLAVGEGTNKLTGTRRMQQRPIGILVNALNELGANITYDKKPGFPPLTVKPFKSQRSSVLSIRGDQSSQFISALLMIAPRLPNGLKLKLEGHLGSKPYIQMTLNLIEKFGVESDWNGDTINITAQNYSAADYTIESDWSAASYWYALVALSTSATIKLIGLRQNSTQGDIAIVSIMNKLGVMSTFEKDGVLLEKIPHSNEVAFDFSDCPDLAQTIAVTCAGKHIKCQMTGLESLRIKETDRIKALKLELKKLNTSFKEVEPGTWEVNSKFEADSNELSFETYEDHRMAMAFAPIATLQKITIQNPEVVSKSYPSFWTDLETAGILSEK
jgi:3-phosphoshikimate 1-carboxyvinyltransferase